MRFFIPAVLYMAAALGANTATAGDVAALEAMRDGTMKKLVFQAEPQPASEVPFTDVDGVEYKLSDWNGKYVLVNFWATWCAPCRHEMPSLDALQRELGGESFEVVTIATGKNSIEGINRFFTDEGIESLPILLDPKQKLARDMAVLGLPITVILDPQGLEIARLRGDADWNSESAKAIISALITGS